MKNFKEKLNDITTFLFDIDGVLTNGIVTVMPDGEMIRNLNSKDGYAIQLAIKKGFRIAIISGGKSQSIKIALQDLGIKDVYLGQSDKMHCYENYISENKLSPDEILYMGDDLPDYDVMNNVSIAACPKNATTEIKQISIYVSDRKGGEGCVRDVIEQVMRCQAKWEITGW